MAGTANNFLAGSLGIGTTTIGAKLQVNNAATVGTGSTAMSAINPIIFVDNGNATNGSIVIKSHAVGAGNVVGALRFASSPDGANYNWGGIEALSSASSIVETLSFKIPSSNASAGTSNEIVRIDTNGLSIGTQSATAGTALVVGRNNGRGIYANGIIPSTLTTTARYVNTTAITAAASFNLTNLQHYFAEQGTFGAGSTVTNQYGFFVDSSMTGATNDFGFYGNLAAGANIWNLFMTGTAANYMAGSLAIGTTSITSKLSVITPAGGNTSGFSVGSTNGLLNIWGGSLSGVVFDVTNGTLNGATGTNILFRQGGTTAMVLTASSNLLLGTTTDLGYKFLISDGTRTCSFNPNSALDAFFIGTYESKPLIFGTGDAERMRIDVNGNFGVGTNASNNASARLQVNSTTQGFLPPRMTATQRAAIASPAEGLIVVQTDGTQGLYLYIGAAWHAITML
jgi:hypothetical protein